MMPEQITQFKTFDGKIFDTEAAAEKWERDANKANGIVSMFPNNIDLCSGDFYQLPTQLITDGRYKLADALQGLVDVDAVRDFRTGTRGSILGRYLGDGDSPFYRVWWMFECIDEQGRMFNQPYFTYNPGRAAYEVSY